MIELKDAVDRSFQTLKEMAIVPESAKVELEEAELDDQGNFWVVTFSYPDRVPEVDEGGMGPHLSAILRTKRAYKAITLWAKDGTIRGIKTIHA